MSRHLYKNTLIRRENLLEMNERGVATKVPVLLCCPALTRTYVERDLRSEYDGRVFYGKDAFEGLRTMDKLMTLKRSGQLTNDEALGRELGGRDLPARREPAPREIGVSNVARDNAIFVP